MKILMISGSARKKSSNLLLLSAIGEMFEDQHDFIYFNDLADFPLFTPEKLDKGVPSPVKEFKNLLTEADAVIISTPEYTHNIPAVLKNMLEWCTHSGEFEHKPVLPITFTPQEPRGKYAMQSLLFSLKTMKAHVAVEMSLYKTDVSIEKESMLLSEDLRSIVKEAIEML
ncbi:NAD(P)H-dependent oxidoreductase [Brumimicrobium salinarum]|uniref:NAD(P)H-dependent oxidoreductase n=1 Tax=Brumimicrobium salinarum TaxID=2058658 RepID=A0A2I0R548_9FLAO|nr:NADPH-dependent FMN reductase [Brumimicrobium salinarum]PKR81714.1 NAD(P)H-dependent oxidoreductase [Brumimicrobium salinarum]